MASAKEYPTDRIRNVGVVGHGGSGKTSLIDSLCFVSGTSKRQGNVADGTALTMHAPEEIAHGISIQLTPAYAEHMDVKINLLDTPGYLDFAGETISGIPVVPAGRGGLITYHGPGQVVGYPILRLREFCAGPKPYVRMLEEVIIRSLQVWDLHGCRREGLPGVWVGADPLEKIASIGVRVRHWVSFHGVSLNADPNLEHFSGIVPCGLYTPATSLAALGIDADMQRVDRALQSAFEEIFGAVSANSCQAP